MKKILYFLSSIVILTSCNDDEILKESENLNSNNTLVMRTNENDKPDEHIPIVLGEKLNNPYTVENMQKAFEYYNSVIPNSPFKGKKVSATHYYIKINPTTERQLEILDELDNSDDEDAPVLHDYPLDYEILEEGDYYVYPRDENDIFHSAYTLIPIDYQLQGNIPYEILDKIYEPTEEEYDVEIVDNCYLGLSNSNNLSPIFNRLSGNVESPTQLKNALKSAYPSKQAQIEELFTSYGY